MSEIIRDAYKRAIIKKNSLPKEVDTEHFNYCLEQIAEILETDLNEIFCSFHLDDWDGSKESIDVYILTWAIKKNLSPMYKDIILVSGHTNTFGGYSERIYRLDVLDKIESLKKRTSEWVWKHKGLVDNFMSDTKTLEKLNKIEQIFPITIIITD